MKASVALGLRYLDQKSTAISLRMFGERKALIILLFHSLFKNKAEIERQVIFPQQAVTIDHFLQIIEYFLDQGFRFTTPEEITCGLQPGENYVLLTFDDGYFNNTRALPVLMSYQVPATFFISTNHVLEQKLFWWDVLYRKARSRGYSESEVARYKKGLKSKRTCEIEQELAQTFGRRAFAPTGELDRPFRQAELADFAQERWVHLGNHTADHAILTNYTPHGVRTQIQSGQQALLEITGTRPKAISYPNGNCSPAVAKVAREEGLQIGITGVTKKNYLPLAFDGLSEMHLGRMVPYGGRRLREQCRAFRADVNAYAAVKNAFNQIGRP